MRNADRWDGAVDGSPDLASGPRSTTTSAPTTGFVDAAWPPGFSDGVRISSSAGVLLGPGGDAESSRQLAAVIFALMMGALQLARLTQDRTRSDRILADAAEAAIRMAREA